MSSIPKSAILWSLVIVLGVAHLLLLGPALLHPERMVVTDRVV